MIRVVSKDDCWLYARYTNPEGYASKTFPTKEGSFARVYIHRIMYEDSFGLIPKGLEIDHLCEEKRCINPDHLEAVTHKENTRRGLVKNRLTHCKRGHEFTDDNTVLTPNRYNTKVRTCKTCRALRARVGYKLNQ